MAEGAEIGINNPRACGECTLCCELIGVPEYRRPDGKGCMHVTGKGCAIHATRPDACRRFQCMWSIVPAFDDYWRPDKCGFVLTSKDMRVTVDVDPARPDAWRMSPYYRRLKHLSMRTSEKFLTVIVRTQGHAVVLFPEADIDLGIDKPEVTIASGYEMRGNKRVPYARYAQ